MKKLKALVWCALLCFSTPALAQTQEIPINEPDYNKPRIFADLPEKMTLRISDAEKLFGFRAGDVVSVQLSDEFLLQGTVISSATNGRSQTVLVKAVSRNNALFSFSRIAVPGEALSYTGRIMSRDNGDALQVIKDRESFIIQKINLYDLISE